MSPPSPTRNRIALWAAVLALCLRLLLPGLHVHPTAGTAEGFGPEVHGSATACGGCACSEFRWPDEQATVEQATVDQATGKQSTGEQLDKQNADDTAANGRAPTATSAAMTPPPNAAADHACFACDFELANPAAPPPAAMPTAPVRLSAAAPLVLAAQRCAQRCPSPPGRAPPTTA